MSLPFIMCKVELSHSGERYYLKPPFPEDPKTKRFLFGVAASGPGTVTVYYHPWAGTVAINGVPFWTYKDSFIITEDKEWMMGKDVSLGTQLTAQLLSCVLRQEK